MIRGNPLDLAAGGIHVVAGRPQVWTDVRLLEDARFAVERGAALTLGNLDVNGFFARVTCDEFMFVAGVISGTGAGSQLAKEGTGTLALADMNTFAGVTMVSGGLLEISGSLPGAVQLSGFATLRGGGTVGSISATDSTRLEPGDRLTVNGPVTLAPGVTMQFAIGSSVAALGYDQLHCLDGVNLGGAQLRIIRNLFFFPPTNTVFVVISNAAAGPVAGTFAGLPEGAVTNLVDMEVRVSYVGGDGNDVTLTVLSLTRVWRGLGGANANWSDPNNWLGNQVPQPGDGLRFPPDMGLRTNSFDFTNGFPVRHITLGQSNYVILGTNELVLRHLLEATNATGAVDFFLAIRAALNPVVFSNAPGGMFNLHGPVTLTGPSGTFAPGGMMSVNGPITASQPVFKRGSGTLRLAGTNQFGVSLQVEEGAVQVLNDRALQPANASVVVQPGARLELLDGRVVNSRLDLRGTLFTGGSSHVLSADIRVNDAPAVIDTTAGSILRIGDFHGSQPIAKIGPGRLILATPGCVNYGGLLSVNEGTVSLPGCVSGGRMVVNAGATLEGTGAIFILTNHPGSRLSPGQGNVPGVLTVLGAFELNAGSVFHVRLDGTVAGSQYSSIITFNAPAVLNGATLDLSLGFTPPMNHTFVLISRSSGPVTGTFAGLPQGSLLTNNGVVFRINYAGGSGDDVALTRVTGPATLSDAVKLGNGQFQFQGQGEAGFTYVIQANTNLSTPDWLTIGSAPANGAGLFQFLDLNAPLHPIRFYRVLSP